MILPGFEAEPERRELGEAFAEFLVHDLVQRHIAGCEFADRLMLIPSDAVAHAAQPATGGGDFGFHQSAHIRGTDGEVAASNDNLGHPAGPETARGAHGGDAGYELYLTQGGHVAWTFLAIHGSAFEEDGGDDVVTAADVGQQVGKEILATLRRIPEMVMRIDDRQIRLQRHFPEALRERRSEGGVIANVRAAVFAL